ncbi:hypothetical protein SAMN04487898_12265 [Pedobacter sp. ok626]|uniref:hypothetical protein n=1 Tax=Pedobacter sp. ok626 TaxID=1761882 RepID=UPI0008911610|nr:hypothetical protein [Pedobacter sp. ok626]SDL66547.1 hypothetical protein SAMN04487898_12265 [Pedobacter sp. ok626]
MKRIKGINVLKSELLDFAEEVIYSLTCELQRITRMVAMTELKFNPFSDEISMYMDAIRLDENTEIIIDTSFADTSEKFLRSCISDLEIDFFGLIDLLELLKAVEGKNGALPSILKPVSGEYITHEEQDRDAWVCLCGNMPCYNGFYSCDEDGDLIEPGDEWEYLYRCEACGRVIDDRDHKVIGINLNPNNEEA